jgi:restriction system protein
LSQQEVEQQRRLCRELLKVDWRELRGGAFVKFLCRVFEAHHAVAVVASNIRDQGVDLVVTLNQVRYTVVIKDLPGTTGNSSVMQAIAGMPIYQCQSSMVISQGTFSPAAIQLAAEQQTTLIDRHQIRSLIDGTHHFYAANTSH